MALVIVNEMFREFQNLSRHIAGADLGTQSNIYDGAFLQKIVDRKKYALAVNFIPKCFFLDICECPKHTFVWLHNVKNF